MGHKLHEALILLNCGPFFCDFSELQTHSEPGSETEEGDKDPGEMKEDSPPADPPRSEAHARYGGNRPTVALVQEVRLQQLYQQHLSLKLGRLKQETNRSAGVRQ